MSRVPGVRGKGFGSWFERALARLVNVNIRSFNVV